jgi:tetraprenyl-beta-curcumene synthase
MTERLAASSSRRQGTRREPDGAQPRSALALDRRLTARAGVALALVNLRYWYSVAPLVRRQLRGWRRRARAIDDPVLRALALAKLDDEGFNAEAAAMLATLAPRAYRRRAVTAMVAAEIIYDYLDGLTESPSREAPQDGAQLFTAFTDAVAPSLPRGGDYYRHHRRSEHCYLEALVTTVRKSLAGLPATAALAGVLHASAARGAAAQLHIHATSLSDTEELERWAQLHAAGTSLQWREFLAGAACSVLAVHALIAAASDCRTTYEQALQLDEIYLSISVLPTILDSLIDGHGNTPGARVGHIRYYDDRETLAPRLVSVIEDVISRSRDAPHGAHHVMTLVGVLAYYTSAPAASAEFARPVTAHLGQQLQPLLAPTLAMMRTWRTAKHLRARWHSLYARASRRAA